MIFLCSHLDGMNLRATEPSSQRRSVTALHHTPSFGLWHGDNRSLHLFVREEVNVVLVEVDAGVWELATLANSAEHACKQA